MEGSRGRSSNQKQDEKQMLCPLPQRSQTDKSCSLSNSHSSVPTQQKLTALMYVHVVEGRYAGRVFRYITVLYIILYTFLIHMREFIADLAPLTALWSMAKHLFNMCTN